jgi:hypothetical protein
MHIKVAVLINHTLCVFYSNRLDVGHIHFRSEIGTLRKRYYYLYATDIAVQGKGVLKVDTLIQYA